MATKRVFRRGAKPSVAWLSLAPTWSLAVAATSQAALISMEEPVLTGSALVAAPPEDLTLIRVVGDFSMGTSATASISWTLGLIVADTTWTASSTFSLDADKRILWHETFTTTTAAAIHSWLPPGTLEIAGTAYLQQNATHVDINPRVRLEPGKALYLVAWENTGAGSIVTSSVNMRLLYSRAKRR